MANEIRLLELEPTLKNLVNDMVVKITVKEGNIVPEPSTLLLVGSGLVGLVAFRKRFKRA
jgi:hypothetical protein